MTKDKNYYEFNGRVRYSEIDHRGTMTLPSLINYFQDCSIFQSEEVGFGTEILKNNKKAWVLSYWQIIVEKYPRLGENITVGTFATEFKGIYGNRNFYMKDAAGKQIACANSIWTFMDLEKKRPVRPVSEEIAAYGIRPRLDMPYEGRKIETADTFLEQQPFPVRKYHIDTNEHVNNCQYVQMALELLNGDTDIRQVRVEYKQSAVLGNMIFPKLAMKEDRTIAELCDESGKAYAIIEMRMR